jgi:DNA-binding CsgD family transcriptional regulator/tetratricopeptide (TPR) repeat protein
MELLERKLYIADLGEWLAAASERGGCIVLVGGEAGIGKTALLQEFSKQQRKTRVLWGACDSLFTPRPLAPVHDIARQTQGALLAAVDTGASRDVIFTAVLDEMEKSAPLIVFEDMHWADEATLDLVKFLGRRIHRTRAMLAATYRDDEVGPRHPLRLVIGDLPRASTRRMLLSPLTESAVDHLARQAGRPSGDLHSITGGNPLFVTEALAANAETIPVTVRDAVLARALRLSPAAREIAELISVVPLKTEPWLLERAVPVDDAAIESCLSIGMVRHEDGSVAFRHEIARRALEDSLPASRHRSLHARVLSILVDRPDISAARLAHHADGAHSVQDVLRCAPIAAKEAAAVGAHRQAVSHYQVALRYSTHLPPSERARLHELLSYEYYLTGETERAIDARAFALKVWRAAGARMNEGDALRWLSRLSWLAGRTAEANQYGKDAVSTLETLEPSPELAMAYGNRAHLEMLAHEAASAIEWAERAIKLAELCGNSEILSHALNTLGTIRLTAGDVSGFAELHRSLQLALHGAFHEQVGRAYSNLSAMAVNVRQYERAFRYLAKGLAYCDEHDLDSWRLYMLACRARARLEQSDWQGASEDAEIALRHPRSTPMIRIPALTVIGYLRNRRGDPDAVAPLEEARTLAGPMPELQRIGTLAALGADAAWLAGDHAGVVRAVQPAYELARHRDDRRMKGELAVWLWRVNALSQPPTDIEEHYALEISGDWCGAARAWRKLGGRYEHATILACYGGESELREALVILEELGAGPMAGAVRKRLRARGARDVPRGRRTSTRSNPHGLTSREAQVLGLLSEGLRNSIIAKRLFVSPKTIEHHVSAILAKFGVTSRAAAVAMARQKSGTGN